ncbi:MAG: LacI family DNA-binding transcriptional regulator [Stellaceae bacterium]
MSALRALASSLGLSITTVSRALDGYGDVAAATRERVRRAAETANYRPNAAARRLRLGTTETVSLVLPGDPGHFDEPLYMELLAALGAQLDAAGLDLMVLAARSPAEELALYRRLVDGRRTDGIVLVRTRVDDPRIRYLAESGIPFVVMGRTETPLSYAHVDGDGAGAFAAAARRLIALGHREIGYVGALSGFTFSKLRREGWAGAMVAAGLSPSISTETAATEPGGLAAVRALLQSAPRPTAILCATDRIAIGGLRAIKEAGLVVGRDVSIAGHDNLSASAFTEPALTTMELPVTKVGTRLAEMLVALIGGADARDFAEVWPVLPIERASIGPAPGAPRS